MGEKGRAVLPRRLFALRRVVEVGEGYIEMGFVKSLFGLSVDHDCITSEKCRFGWIEEFLENDWSKRLGA